MTPAHEKRYQELLRAEAMLKALEAAGVDNWDGYYHATRHLYEDQDHEDTKARRSAFAKAVPGSESAV